MKKILSITLVAALAFGFTACKKNSANSDGTNFLGSTNNTTVVTPPVVDPLAAVGPLPQSFTKKAVLEEFTGEWCGWCPEGADVMKNVIAANPGKVIGIAVHDGDPMELPTFNAWIKTLTGVSGYPNGSVDRADATSRGSWAGQIGSELAKTANLGLAMVTKKTGSTYSIKVFIGYTSPLPATSRLTVAITEDQVAQSAGGQHNYSSSVVVDGNWKHSHVLRGFVTSSEGDIVALNSPKKYTIVEFTDVDLSKMGITNFANVSVAAFVNENATPRDIYNAQESGLNEIKKWD